MIEKIKQKLALRCMKNAVYYAEKGGFKNTMKSLDWVEKSMLFADDEERNYLKKSFEELISKYQQKKEDQNNEI